MPDSWNVTPEAFDAWMRKQCPPALAHLAATGVEVAWGAQGEGGCVRFTLPSGSLLLYRTIEAAGGFVDGWILRTAEGRP